MNYNIKDKHLEIFGENVVFSNNISLADCQNVAKWIKEENSENWKHMIEKTADELYAQINKYWWCGIKVWDNLIWFICIMTLTKDWLTLFEPWSLFVKKEYRNKWRWQKMKWILLEKHSKLPMYSITNVEAVKKINKHLGQYEYTKKDIQEQILQVIETAWKLLEDDMIYGNEIFNTLIKKNDKII